MSQHLETGCGPDCEHDRKIVFPAGPWHNEPDREEFTQSGLHCLLHRAPLGHWCGYVAVPPRHPLHNKEWDHGDCESKLEVHGGLTYSEMCTGPVCHVPPPGEPENVWWFGFDCAHSGDLIPSMAISIVTGKWKEYDTYRDINYTREQTKHLARQLAALSTPSEFELRHTEEGLPLLQWGDDIQTAVVSTTFGRGRVIIARKPNCYIFPDGAPGSLDDGWCYETLGAALLALAKWNPLTQPEPEGWIKHINTERRRIDGDPRFEYRTYEEQTAARSRYNAMLVIEAGEERLEELNAEKSM